MVNSELGTYDFCEADSDANQWGWAFNPKGSGAWGGAPGGGCGGQSPPQEPGVQGGGATLT